MAQRSGFHNILNIPVVYNTVQKLFFHKKSIDLWKKLVGESKGVTILDIGCGPGKESMKFKDSNYIGIDISEDYIREAKLKYGSSGNFYTLSIDDIEKLPSQNIDIVVLKGVLHHLNDSQIFEFLNKIESKLSPDAKIIASDPVYTLHQNPISKTIISMDRGKNVRTDEGYRQLAKGSKFSVVYSEVIKQKFPPYQRHFMCWQII